MALPRVAAPRAPQLAPAHVPFDPTQVPQLAPAHVPFVPQQPPAEGPIGQFIGAAGAKVAQVLPGMMTGAARAVPETIKNSRRALIEGILSAVTPDMGAATPRQREAVEKQKEAFRKGMEVATLFSPLGAVGEPAAAGVKALEDGFVKPWEKHVAGTPRVQRIDQKFKKESEGGLPLGKLITDPEAVGSAIGTAGASLIPIAAAPNSAAGYVLGAVMEAGGALRDIERYEEETGKTLAPAKKAATVALTAAISGTLERFGFEVATGKLAEFLPKQFRKGFMRAVAQGVQGAVGEIGTEETQTVAANVIQKLLVDPTQEWNEGWKEALIGAAGTGGGAGLATGAGRSMDVAGRANRMKAREQWRAEEAPWSLDDEDGGKPVPADVAARTANWMEQRRPTSPATPMRGADDELARLKMQAEALDARVRSIKSEMGMPTVERPAVTQAELDAINESVRGLQNPATADEALARLKTATQALEARVGSLRSNAPAPAVEPQAPRPARPISVDQLLGAQALPGVVKETRFRDQTAEARGRNVLQAVAGEERQRIAQTPGAALRMILGDDPAFRMAPAPESVNESPAPVNAGVNLVNGKPETVNAPAQRTRVSMPVLDWIERYGQGIDEDRRTAPPEEWTHDESRYFALTDPGLGLPNRAAYVIAERQNPTALQGVLDVDGLKNFNDTFGHENGDEYLGMVPLFARQHGLRLFRVGGDEFVAMYDGEETVFREKLETARTGLEASRVPGATETGEAYPLHKGFSYGIGRDFKTADAQAYEDKRRRKGGSSAGTDRQGNAEPVGVGRGAGPEAPAGPGNPARVPTPVRGPRSDGGSGSSGAPPAGPASLPPPVAPPAAAAARPAPRGPEAQAAPPPKPAPVDAFAGKKAGKEGEVFTAGGERVGYRWRLANLFRDLIPSHTETFEPNPRFPSEYQPRDRARVASRDQIEGMSKGIRPGALGESYYASDGAPIVGSDGVIESGNARSIAAQMAYRAGRMGDYVTWAEENAERFGYTPEDVRAEGDGAFFVRERITPTDDRGELVKQFNVPTVARMSDAETARADADRLTPELLARFFPADDGLALRAVRNRPFVAGFFETIPENERGEMLDEDGQLSKGGLSRIQNALLGKAYGRSPVLERLTESADDNIKQISSALVNAAPAMATLRGAIESGEIRSDLDPTPALVEAAQKLSWLRETGGTVSDYLRQDDLFGEGMTAAGQEVLRSFEDFKRSGKKTTAFLTELARGITLGGSARQESLFGDLEALPLESFVRTAGRYVGTDGDTTGSLFGGEEAPAPDDSGRPGPKGVSPRGPAGSVDRPRVSLRRGADPGDASPRQVMLVERWARSMAESWKDAPKIVVVATEADLPEAIRERAQSFDAAGSVEAVYMGAKDDRVFLVAARLKSREDVQRVVLHEVMGHAGLRRILDRSTFGSVMDQIADSLPKDVEAKAREYGLDLKDKGQRREAADEVLAEWASRPEAPPRAITRAMVTIRGWLRKHFPSLKWTEADVRGLLAKARTRIEEGRAEDREEGAPRFSRAVDERPAGDHLGEDVREQLSLFTPEQLRGRAQQALDDLGGDRGSVRLVGEKPRGLEGAGIRTRADAFARAFRRQDGVDFRGIEVKDAEDLVVAARVVRDPRLETLRVFYIKDNRIVGHEAWTSRLPAAVDFQFGRIDELRTNIRRRLQRFGADGYYLLHNHPSGDPTPSAGDEGLAKSLSKEVPGLLGSVVMDHNRYGLITDRQTRGGRFGSYVLNLSRENVLEGDESQEPERLESVRDTDELAAIGKRYHEGRDVATVFYQDAKLRVVAVQDVPMGRLLGKGAVDFFRGQLRRFGSTGIAAYLPLVSDTDEKIPARFRSEARAAWDVARKLNPLFRAGIMHEAVGENVGSVRNSGIVSSAYDYKLGLHSARALARRVGEEREEPRFSRPAPSPEQQAGERRLMQLMADDARRRAESAASAVRRVQEELADPGDILEARKDESLPEHSREIQGHIRPVGKKGDTEPLLNPLEATYQQVVRRHYALEKTSGRLGATSGEAHKDPGVVAELAAGHAARAEQFLVGNGGFRIGADGNPEWTGNRSLAQVLGTLGPGRLNELRRYLVARRAIELHHRSGPQKELVGEGERTIFSGISEAAAQQEIAGAPEDVKTAAEEVTALLDDALRYWADAGGLSPKAVDVIRDLNRAYVPFYRIFEGKDPAKRSGRLVLPVQRGAALQAEQAVKKMFGSGRNILDPLVAVSDHIQRMIRAADLNRVGRSLVEAAALKPAEAEGLVEEVPQPGRDPAATREGQVVQDAAGGYGVDVTDEAASAISYLSDKKLTFANDRIRVWQDGKLKEWRVEKSIGEALRALGPEDVSLARTLLSLPAKALRAGVTKNPIFALHNFLRDTGDAGVQSRNGFRPLLDSVIGLREAIRDGNLRREWLAAGGGYATLSGGGIRGAEAALKEVAPKTKLQSVLRTVRHPLDALALLNRPFEEAARLGEYRRAREKGKSATEAALDSARVTTNFTVHGTDAFWWGLVKASAFVNPAIQGTDKAFRSVLEAPRGQKPSVRAATAAAANVVFKGLLHVGTLSALFYLLADDDDEIKELRRTKQGALWWFVRVPGTEVIARFPKPFLWGQVFGTGVEAVLDRSRGENPRAYKEWRREVLKMISDGVMPIPTAVKTGFELALNRSTFFQRPIVTRSLEGVEPRYQANPSTSQLARKAGDLFNVSPAKIEYGVGAVGGTLGREALRAGDVFLKKDDVSGPTSRPGDLPLVGRAFARTPDLSSDATETFYDELTEVRKAVSTMKLLEKQDPAEARKRRPEYRRALLASKRYEDAAEFLSDTRKLIEKTRKKPDAVLSREEKRKKIDSLVTRMNLYARRLVDKRLLEERER